MAPPTWGVAKSSSQNNKMSRQIEVPSWGGEGKSATFQITQQRSNISRSLFHTKDVYSIPCPLLTAVSKFAYLLSTSCEERKCALCSEEGPIKRRQIWQPFSVGYTKFYRQHRCGGKCIQEQSGHTSTRGTVSSLLFFLLKLLLHKVYISNILCGLRL